MCTYRLYFVLVSLLAPLCAAGALTLLLLLAAAAVESAASTWAAVAALAALAVFMQLKSTRIRNRIAAWPGFCAREFVPHTCAELQLAIAQAKRTGCRRGAYPEIVGHGWGYFLSRTASQGPRIYTHRMQKREGLWWNAGATLEDVARHYEQKENGNKALTSAPTMNYISVGAWFAMGNHGNGGNHPQTLGSSGTMRQARIVDMETQEVRCVDYKKLRCLFDDPATARRYCVLQVCIDESSLAENKFLKKCAIDVNTKETADEWLKGNARLRVLFMGAARSYGLGIRWDDADENELKQNRHVDPHFGSRRSTYLQADVCSIVCGWREATKKWSGVTTYANANRWMPFVFPWQMALTAAAGYINYELVFRLACFEKTKLWRLVCDMIQVHRLCGGRSEVRHGQSGKAIFLDVSMRAHFKEPLRVIKALGVEKFALHPGKYQLHFSDEMLCEIGLERCTLGQIYFGTDESLFRV